MMLRMSKGKGVGYWGLWHGYSLNNKHLQGAISQSVYLFRVQHK